MEKSRAVTSWNSHYQRSEIARPWCGLLAQTSLNQSMTAYTPTFLIESNKNANVVIKDVSTVLCSIRLNECEGSSIAVLESKGSKGYIYVNGRVIK
ncbi:hypothetical protein HanXRQr2_Chr13g0583291 [Helianthus annuus]|nr:hypothetical protein HanXRQr2_Chr13g0583291 [Helianthus annuus]